MLECCWKALCLRCSLSQRLKHLMRYLKALIPIDGTFKHSTRAESKTSKVRYGCFVRWACRLGRKVQVELELCGSRVIWRILLKVWCSHLNLSAACSSFDNCIGDSVPFPWLSRDTGALAEPVLIFFLTGSDLQCFRPKGRFSGPGNTLEIAEGVTVGDDGRGPGATLGSVALRCKVWNLINRLRRICWGERDSSRDESPGWGCSSCSAEGDTMPFSGLTSEPMSAPATGGLQL